jgi:hypothetical protein
MRHFADILGEVIENMDLSICVETVTDLGDDLWKLSICDCSTTLHAMPSTTNRNLYASNSGTDYKITAIDHDVSITVESETEPATGNYTLARPAYMHGTPMEISAEIAKKQTDISRYPLIWLLEIINTDVSGSYDPLSSIEMQPDSRIFVLDYADYSALTEDLYDAPVRPMANLADRITKEFVRQGVSDNPIRVNQIPYAKFGSNYTNANTADRSSALLSWLVDHTGGVELRLTIPIYKQIN